MITGNEFLSHKSPGIIVHQVWFSSGASPPGWLRPFIKSWKIQHPEADVVHVMWNMRSALSFFRAYWPQHLGFFVSLESPVQQCDYFRLFLLYQFGGVYADCDMECREPFLKEVMEGNCPILLLQSPLFTEEYTNCLMVARFPEEPFWLEVAETIKRTTHSVRDGSGVSGALAVYFRIPIVSRLLRLAFTWMITGPGCLDRTLARDHYDVVTLAPERFYDGPTTKHHEAAQWFSFWDFVPFSIVCGCTYNLLRLLL
jgi:hypothetical protein